MTRPRSLEIVRGTTGDDSAATATRSLLVHEQAGIVAPDRDHTAAEHVLDYDAIPFRDGFLEPAPGDGIGITVDGAAVEREAVDPRAWTFEPPRWKLDDGSWAEY